MASTLASPARHFRDAPCDRLALAGICSLAILPFASFFHPTTGPSLGKCDARASANSIPTASLKLAPPRLARPRLAPLKLGRSPFTLALEMILRHLSLFMVLPFYDVKHAPWMCSVHVPKVDSFIVGHEYFFASTNGAFAFVRPVNYFLFKLIFALCHGQSR